MASCEKMSILHISTQGEEYKYLEARASTRNAQSKCSATTNMGIVAFTKELHNPGYLAGILEKEEGQRGNGGTTNIVRGVRNGNVKKLADGIIVCSSCISQGKRIDTSISQDWVLQ